METAPTMSDRTHVLEMIYKAVPLPSSKTVLYEETTTPALRFFLMHGYFIRNPCSVGSTSGQKNRYAVFAAAECFRFIMQINKNENVTKTTVFLTALRKLEVADKKHPDFAGEGFSNRNDNAYMAFRCEVLEFLYALKAESIERQIEEAYDVIVTATRYLNREY